MVEENYNVILKQAVRAVLKPEGLFQKGSSRIWVDDNGWFFTVVEFQGSWCDRGSYLNVGMQHLWNDWESLLTVCGIREAREPEWAGYEGNAEIFLQKISAMAKLALERIFEYRVLADLQIAKKTPLKTSGITPFWAFWNQFMTAALAGDIPLALKSVPEMRYWLKRIPINGAEENLQRMLTLSGEPQRFYAYIVDRIAAQRSYWRTKPGLKRLAVHPEFN